MRLRRSLSLAVALGALVGCGSETVHELPPAAEPPRSPAPAHAPAGRVTAVGNGPEGVVSDAASGLVAVALRDPPVLALVDAATGVVRRRVVLPGAPRHLALARAGGPVLAPAESADRLLEVSLPDGAVRRSVRVGAHPHDVTPAANAVLVGDERGNALSVVRGGQVTATAKVATQPGGVAALDGGRRVAAVSVRERVLEVFDTRTLRRIGRASAGVGPTHVACLEHGPCYVVDTRGGALLVFSVGAGVEPTRRYAPAGWPVRHRARSGPPPALRHASCPQRAGRARRSWAPACRATLAHRAPAGLGGGRRAHRGRVRHGAGGRGARARDALTRTR